VSTSGNPITMYSTEVVWFVEIQYKENNQIFTEKFTTTCAKYNTAGNRAWKWSEKNNKTVLDIYITRSKQEINFPQDSYVKMNIS
jgi:hypothetical protein